MKPISIYDKCVVWIHFVVVTYVFYCSINAPKYLQIFTGHGDVVDQKLGVTLLWLYALYVISQYTFSIFQTRSRLIFLAGTMAAVGVSSWFVALSPNLGSLYFVLALVLFNKIEKCSVKYA